MSSSKSRKKQNKKQMPIRIEMGLLNKLLVMLLIVLRNLPRGSSDKAPLVSWILRTCSLK